MGSSGGGVASRELPRIPQRRRAGGRGTLDHDVKDHAAGGQRRIGRRGRGREEIGRTAAGRDPRRRRPPAPLPVASPRPESPQYLPNLQLTHRQRLAAGGVGQQFLSPRQLSTGASAFYRPTPSSAPRKSRRVPGDVGRKENRRTAAVDKGLELFAGLGIRERCLPQAGATPVPSRRPRAGWRPRLPPHISATDRARSRPPVRAAGRPEVFHHHHRPPRRGLLEDEPEIVVRRVGIRRDRHPTPAPVTPFLERDPMVL